MKENVHKFMNDRMSKNNASGLGEGLGINSTIRTAIPGLQDKMKSTCFEHPWSKRLNERRRKASRIYRTTRRPTCPDLMQSNCHNGRKSTTKRLNPRL